MNPVELTSPCSVAVEPTGSPKSVCSALLSRPESKAAAIKPSRVAALDFAKGALVLIMVLYHWMNYFVSADGSVYKYLRFLTPSFIFITGFLIAQVYLFRAESPGPRASRRLLVRGLKLLVIVAVLNVLLTAIPTNGLRVRMNYDSPAEMATAFLLGTSPVAFSVLVPIAYLLIFSAILLGAWRYNKLTFHIACAISLIVAFVLDLKGFKNNYLQIFSLGTLGISLGHISMARLNKILSHFLVIAVSYVAYLAAITLWDVTFSLQIAGVSLSLAIIYLLGKKYGEANRIGETVVLLGQYSLFGYIAQIIILQVIRKVAHALGSDTTIRAGALLVGAVCTILVVVAMDSLRRRGRRANQMYTAVFG